jgi:hypothetical protein
LSGGVLVAAIVAALLFLAVAVQITARQLQRYPLDSRRPGPLIDTSRETTWVVRPVELEQLNSIVAESLSSEAVARAKLVPMLDELERATPAGRDSSTIPATSDTGKRRSRTRLFEDRIGALESKWEIDDGR